MVYQPDNAYTKKYGYQFGQFITNPTNHLAGQNVFTNILIQKKKIKNILSSMVRMEELR